MRKLVCLFRFHAQAAESITPNFRIEIDGRRRYLNFSLEKLIGTGVQRGINFV